MHTANPKTIEYLLTELIKTLSSVIEEKDPYLRGHADRVTNICMAFAGYLELAKLETKHIYLAGLLHDVAKIYLPEEILGKTEGLNADEMVMVQQHPVIGERILAPLTITPTIVISPDRKPVKALIWVVRNSGSSPLDGIGSIWNESIE